MSSEKHAHDVQWTVSSCSEIVTASARSTGWMVILLANCGLPAAACSSVEAIGRGRAVFHWADDTGLVLVVDGIEKLRLFLPLAGLSSNEIEAVCAPVLSRVALGWSLEEALVHAVLQLSARPDPSAVLNLMRSASDRSPWRVAVSIIMFAGTSLLLGTKDRSSALIPDVLYLPGGKVEHGESPLAAAQRELLEETGLEALRLEICGYATYRGPGTAWGFVQFLSVAWRGRLTAGSDLLSAGWSQLGGLTRSSVFPLTWAQLVLLGRQSHPNLPSATSAAIAALVGGTQ